MDDDDDEEAPLTGSRCMAGTMEHEALQMVPSLLRSRPEAIRSADLGRREEEEGDAGEEGRCQEAVERDRSVGGHIQDRGCENGGCGEDSLGCN